MSDISPTLPDTWRLHRFITMDVDWAPDEAVEFCLELLLESNTPATVFLTHDAPWLARVRDSEQLEWGLHPNFERVVPATGKAQPGLGSIRQILTQSFDWAPSLRVLRPHGLLTAGRWLPLYAELGFTHLSSIYPRLQHVGPFEEYNGMVQVPIHWSDTGHLYLTSDVAPEARALEQRMSEEVFTLLLFHPIHVFLNTESLEHYQVARTALANGESSIRNLRSPKGSILPAFRAALQWASA